MVILSCRMAGSIGQKGLCYVHILAKIVLMPGGISDQLVSVYDPGVKLAGRANIEIRIGKSVLLSLYVIRRHALYLLTFINACNLTYKKFIRYHQFSTSVFLHARQRLATREI